MAKAKLGSGSSDPRMVEEGGGEATCPEVAAVEGKEGDQSQGLGGKREEEEVERTCSSSTSSSSRSLNLLLLFFLVVRQDDNLG